MNKYRTLLLITIFFFLFSIPFLFWGKLYFVGGDDSRLYYLFPLEYLKYFTPQLISDNMLGSLGNYFSQSYIAPFVGLIYLLKKLLFFLNIQFFFYGANIAFGFLFFYLITGIWVKNKSAEIYFTRILSSLMYVTSIFSLYTVWSHQLFSLYFISIFPLIFYLLTKSITENKVKFAILAGFVVSIFSVLLFSIPWLSALIISSLPFLLMFACKKKQLFISLSAFTLIVLGLNFYWLLHFVYSPVSTDKITNNIISSTSTVESRYSNEFVIKAVASHNQILFPLLNVYHKAIQKDFSWPTLKTFESWHLKLLPFNSAFLFLICLAGLLLKPRDRLKKLYSVALLSFLVSVFFFTVNIGNWGLPLFIKLNLYVPGFSMFRNMYDKFGITVSFSYAFILFISLQVLLEKIVSTGQKKIILLIVFILILVNAKPFILGDYFNRPLQGTNSTFTRLSNLNTDFFNLANYLKKMKEPSRFIWLPLNNANYVFIRDSKLKNNYYIGVSPLQFLANSSDFNGKLSFNSEVGNSLISNIHEKKYSLIGRTLQKYNVKYIIVNNDISSDLQLSYLLDYKLYRDQNQDFKDSLLGERVKNFGAKYTLYKINNKYSNEKIYLTNSYNAIPPKNNQLSFKKIKSYKYEIKIYSLTKKMKLVFLDPYHKGWEIYFKNGNILAGGKHDLVFNYANGWTLDPKAIKKNLKSNLYKVNSDGSIDLNLILYFKPHSYSLPGIITSFIFLIFCIFYFSKK